MNFLGSEGIKFWFFQIWSWVRPIYARSGSKFVLFGGVWMGSKFSFGGRTWVWVSLKFDLSSSNVTALFKDYCLNGACSKWKELGKIKVWIFSNKSLKEVSNGSFVMSLQRPLAVCLFAVFADLIHFFGSFFTVHCAEWPAKLVFSPEIKKSWEK